MLKARKVYLLVFDLRYSLALQTLENGFDFGSCEANGCLKAHV